MKCISLWQPWASLIAWGDKSVETRSWETAHRGPLAIQASKKWNRELAGMCIKHPEFRQAMLRRLGRGAGGLLAEGDLKTLLPRGYVVATCTLVKVVRTEAVRFAHEAKSPLKVLGMRGGVMEPVFDRVISAEEIAFGDYTPHRFAWLLTDLRPLRTPLQWDGAQGLFEVPDSEIERCM